MAVPLSRRPGIRVPHPCALCKGGGLDCTTTANVTGSKNPHPCKRRKEGAPALPSRTQSLSSHTRSSTRSVLFRRLLRPSGGGQPFFVRPITTITNLAETTCKFVLRIFHTVEMRVKY